jgi:hypothetical protein
MMNIPALSLQTFHLSVDYYFSLQCEVDRVQILRGCTVALSVRFSEELENQWLTLTLIVCEQ